MPYHVGDRQRDPNLENYPCMPMRLPLKLFELLHMLLQGFPEPESGLPCTRCLAEGSRPAENLVTRRGHRGKRPQESVVVLEGELEARQRSKAKANAITWVVQVSWHFECQEPVHAYPCLCPWLLSVDRLWL